AVIRPDGSGMRTVTARCGDPALNDSLDPGSGADDSDPDWSPDGTRIVFTRVVWFCGNCDQDEIFMMNPDGSHVRWVTTDTSLAGAYPAWSPDGRRLVADVGGIAILNLAGKVLRTLDPLGAEPAWQPGNLG